MATLTQLEYLLAVDRLRHFGKAARACHVSQPTLSMALQKLEDEYGGPLFDRSRKPILPTPQGELVIEQAKAVLREMGKLDHLVRNRSKEPTGDFRLALIPTIAPTLLPLFLGDFARRFPAVNLLVDEMTTENILRALDEDRIDAGILATPLHHQGLTERPLYYEPFWLYLSERHPLIGVEQIREERLGAADSKDIWLLSEGHCLRNQILRVCSLKGKAGIFPNVRFESGSLDTLIRLVDEGHGYTLIPELGARALMKSKKRQLKPFTKPVPSREVSLVYRRTQYKQPILDALADEIRKAIPAELPREKSRSIEVVKI